MTNLNKFGKVLHIAQRAQKYADTQALLICLAIIDETKNSKFSVIAVEKDAEWKFAYAVGENYKFTCHVNDFFIGMKLILNDAEKTMRLEFTSNDKFMLGINSAFNMVQGMEV
jgi:hypothetical protein